MFFLVHAESPTQADQQDYGGDSPNDPEHGEEHAHLVRPEDSECFA